MKTLILMSFSVLSIMISTSSFAQTRWDANHPRRTEVNARLNNQNHRINAEERRGEIGPGEANRLHRNDARIRHEERNMASTHNCHITRRDQNILNRQENRNSRRIGY